MRKWAGPWRLVNGQWVRPMRVVFTFSPSVTTSSSTVAYAYAPSVPSASAFTATMTNVRLHHGPQVRRAA